MYWDDLTEGGNERRMQALRERTERLRREQETGENTIASQIIILRPGPPSGALARLLRWLLDHPDQPPE